MRWIYGWNDQLKIAHSDEEALEKVGEELGQHFTSVEEMEKCVESVNEEGNYNEYILGRVIKSDVILEWLNKHATIIVVDKEHIWYPDETSIEDMVTAQMRVK